MRARVWVAISTTHRHPTDRSLRGFPGITQFWPSSREDSLRRVHPRSRHPPIADQADHDDSSHAEGVRVAGDAGHGSAEVLSKAVLQQRLWPDTFVAEANLSNLVAEIREALTTPAAHAAVHPNRPWVRLRVLRQPPSVMALDGPRPSIDRPAGSSGARPAFPLSPGEHVIGRDPDVEVRSTPRGSPAATPGSS